MITAAVLINGEPIFARSAVNLGEAGNGFTRYRVDDGTTILHRRENGAIPLAIRLLKTVHEEGTKKKKPAPKVQAPQLPDVT